MKGISPMIATVLLLAFTIAVGGIISVWLTGMTRTQTAGVTTAAQCASTRLDVTASNITVNATGSFVQVTYTNMGPETIYPLDISLACGSSSTIAATSENGAALTVGYSNQKIMNLGGLVCANTNITVRVTAKCGSDQKATVYGECINTNC